MKLKQLLFFFLISLSTNSFAQEWIAKGQGLLPNDYGTYSVSVIDENTIWANSFNFEMPGGIDEDHVPIVLRSTDGGQSWEVFQIEAAIGRISFDIEAVDANTAFITTNDFGSGAGRGIFRTTDGGQTWEEVFSHPSAGVWVRFFDQNEGIVINRQSMARTIDGGDTWTLVLEADIPVFNDTESTLITSGNNSCVARGNSIWFGTDNSRIFRSTDRGQTWEVFSTGFLPDGILFSVAFEDETNGMCINYTNNGAQFAKTSDGGQTWESVPLFPPLSVTNIVHVTGAANPGAYVVSSPSIGFPSNWISAYTINNGEDWETFSTAVPYTGMEFVDANTGWAGSAAPVSNEDDPGIFKWQGDIFVNTFDIEPIKQFEVFPNPFDEIIQIDENTSNYQIDRIEISDSNGSILKTFNSLNNNSINCSDLPNGIYFITFHSKSSKTTQMIIKAD